MRAAAGESVIGKATSGAAGDRDREVLRTFARRINAADAGAHNNLGALYWAKGLDDEAAAAFMRAVELDPGMQVARSNLEVAFVQTGKAAAMVAHLRERLRVDPTDRATRFELGRTHALLNQHVEAAREFSELLRQNPNDVDALVRSGLAERALGDVAGAWHHLTQALALDPDNVRATVTLADIAHDRGTPAEALTLLQRAVELDPRSHEAYYLMGFVLGDLGRADEAQAATQRAVELNPALAHGESNLAIMSRARPAASTEKGPAPAPPPPPRDERLTHYRLGLEFQGKGNYAEALREYRLAVQSGEDRDVVEQAMAEAFLLSRDGSSALRLYDALLARLSGTAKLHNERGVALHQTGRYADALQSYEQALSADGDCAPAHNNVGVARYHGGDVQGAFEAFRRALESHPGFIKARLNQALLLYKVKRQTQALEAFRQVLAVDANQPVAWNGVGLVLADLKKPEEARGAFARAIQARPRYAEAHYNLSFTLSNLGDFEGALRETKLAIELDPYYVPQKFELAVDPGPGDSDLSIQTDVGQEKRVAEAVEQFAFDPGMLDSVFQSLAPPVAEVVEEPGGDPLAEAAELMARGAFDRAQTAATRALSRGADRVRGSLLLGDIFARRALWGEALERYREARRYTPDSPDAMQGEATALLRLGRAIEARHVAEALLPRRPESIEALMLVAASRAEAGDPQGAFIVLEEARRLAPMRADVHRHIADLAWKLRDADAAIASYRSALQIDPQYAVARYQLANVLIERNLWFDAERELLLALDAVPTYSEATLTLSRLLRRVGRPDEALPLLVDLLQRDPYHFDALIALGETLLELGRKEDANVAFSRVLRFDPMHVGALYYDGAVLAEKQLYKEATERFQQVIDLAPSSEYARRARREIKSAADLSRRLARQPAG